MIDISQKEILLSYLIDRGLIHSPENTQIKYCGGGVSGSVALVTEGEECFLVKQALASLKVAADWQCDPSRMRVEYEAQKTYASLAPDQVSRAICYDAENYIMVREAAPDAAWMWKADLLCGKLDFDKARQAIEALLAVHNRTAADEQVKATFSDSQFFRQLRVEPYIETVAAKHPQLKEQAQRVIDLLMSERIALIHGDFSPKNILLLGERLYILDFEVAYYGHPAFDVAFFANHFLLKSVKNKQWADAYLNMLSYMMDIYYGGVECRDPHLLQSETAEVLGFLFLARVDGKSPVEYLTDEADKQLVRDVAYRILREAHDMGAVIELVRAAVKGTTQKQTV